MTDRSGSLVQHYEYTAFGRDRYTSSTTAFPVSRKFTGQILDVDTGLYYYNYRYYDPQLAKFIQPDDIIPDLANPQSFNRYAYCLNNPLVYTDPTGHWGMEVADWWQHQVNVASGYVSAGPSHWVWNGTVGTLNSLVGGIGEPLRLGSSAGEISGNPNTTAGQVVLGTLLEAGRVAAVVPVGAAIGKGTSALVNSVAQTAEREAVAEVATEVGTGGLQIKVNPNTGELGGVNISGLNGRAGRQVTPQS